MVLRSQRILLTGARGCLAGILDDHLIALGAKVTKFSREADAAHLPLSSALSPGALADADILMHLAWSTVPYTSEQAPGAEERQDLPLLAGLLEGLASVPKKSRPHLIFFSSGGSVYGNATGAQAHRETDRCSPVGRHGAAKVAAEQLIAAHAATHALDWTILRISNPYGFPIPASRPQGIIPAALRAARSGGKLSIWGDGSARKDFLYHTDFRDAITQVLVQRPSGIFNLCSGESHSIREILSLVEHAVGRPIDLEYAAAHAWDVHDSLLDRGKISAALDWRPHVPLAEGIRRTARHLELA